MVLEHTISHLPGDAVRVQHVLELRLLPERQLGRKRIFHVLLLRYCRLCTAVAHPLLSPSPPGGRAQKGNQGSEHEGYLQQSAPRDPNCPAAEEGSRLPAVVERPYDCWFG